jgi:SAM-dependent methyltransferase
MSGLTSPEAARLVYGGINPAVLAAVPLHARRILDVGCGSGTLGLAIKERQPAEVVGLTYSEAEARGAAGRLDRVVVCDLNEFDPAELGTFDCVICSHVLEHLYWPGRFLIACQPVLAPGGRLVVALPNVLAWRQRLAFLFGRFRYTDGGLMDRTHFRFFDRRTAHELVAGAGYRVVTRVAEGVFPLARFLPGLGRVLNRAAVRLAPGLFAWQFVITAELPGRRLTDRGLSGVSELAEGSASWPSPSSSAT